VFVDAYPVELDTVPNRPSLLIGRLVTGVALSLLAGCFTGERGTLVDPPPGGEAGRPSGDTNADIVLNLLETKPSLAFTARYQLTLNFGGVVSEATITEDAISRRSVTIGGVRFLSTGIDQTCTTATGVCEAGLLDARTSDLGFTSTFDREVPAKRLRLSTSRKTGPTTATTEVIAGLPATCVTVPVGAGSELYCALETGGLARMDGADVHVELTTYEGVTTEALFLPT
jgi:hypothetical protein